MTDIRCIRWSGFLGRHRGGCVAGSAALAVLAGLCAPPNAEAADSPGTTTANVEVGSAITLSELTPSFTLVGNPGQTESTTVTMTVATNNFAGYTVTVVPETATMAPTIVGSTASIPIGDLQVRETGTTPFSSLAAGTPTLVHTQATASAPGGDALSNDYRITVPFVREDTYSAKLDYVATTL